MNADLPGWLAPLAQQLEPWLPALTITGVIMAVASLVALPWFLVRIPENYFTQAYSPHQNRGVVAWLVWLLRNLLAILLLVAGILMLILPGQGLLTILIAIMTSTFPGKYRLERAIMRRPGVFRAANWIRARYHRRPLEHPDAFKEPSHGHYPNG